MKLYNWDFLLSDGEYFHIRYAAHTLNLIVKNGLKAIDDCVVKLGKVSSMWQHLNQERGLLSTVSDIV